VSGTDLPFAIRRILIALDASPDGLSALETSAWLAARMNAELQGLFVEDESLLRIAEIPLAREVPYFSATGMPLSREGLELTFRAHAERVRAALSLAAQRARITSSFRSVRGHVGIVLSTAAGEVDLAVVGGAVWSLGSHSRVSVAARQIISASAPVLLLPKHGIAEPVHLVVFFDGTKSAEHGLEAAHGLAAAGLDGITILAPSDMPLPDFRDARPISAVDLRIRSRLFNPSNDKSMLQALEAERGGVLVLGGRDLLTSLPPLEAVLFTLEMPVLLLATKPSNT
jgi:hypothetical protein